MKKPWQARSRTPGFTSREVIETSTARTRPYSGVANTIVQLRRLRAGAVMRARSEERPNGPSPCCPGSQHPSGHPGNPSVSHRNTRIATDRPAPAHQRDEVAGAQPVADAPQGVQLATLQKLARYWGTEYDWRPCEAKLNAVPNFITEIDGLDIHFIHVRSKHENALPIIITHGWPGSVVEQLKIIDPLTNPTAHGGSAVGCVRCRDPVDGRATVFRASRRRPVGTAPAWLAPGPC